MKNETYFVTMIPSSYDKNSFWNISRIIIETIDGKKICDDSFNSKSYLLVKNISKVGAIFITYNGNLLRYYLREYWGINYMLWHTPKIVDLMSDFAILYGDLSPRATPLEFEYKYKCISDALKFYHCRPYKIGIKNSRKLASATRKLYDKMSEDMKLFEHKIKVKDGKHLNRYITFPEIGHDRYCFDDFQVPNSFLCYDFELIEKET